MNKFKVLDNGLKINKISKAFDKKYIVRDISLNIQKGEIVGLLGPNGAGKTTTFYMIVGLISPDTGSIFLDKEDISNLPIYIRGQKGISYLPQEASVFRKLTVEENILAVLESLNISSFEKKKRARSLLRELNILHIKNARAYSLSGGERRRVEISRALAMSPVFILLDEPFAGIDPIATLTRSPLTSLVPPKRNRR